MYDEFLSVRWIETLYMIISVSLVCCTILHYLCGTLSVLLVWEWIAEVLYMLRTGHGQSSLQEWRPCPSMRMYWNNFSYIPGTKCWYEVQSINWSENICLLSWTLENEQSEGVTWSWCNINSTVSSQRSISFRSESRPDLFSPRPWTRNVPPANTKRRDSKLWSETFDVCVNHMLTSKEIKRQEV